MGWINYNNTQAVGIKLKNDIKRISNIVDIGMQGFFICFYTYNIFDKINAPHKLLNLIVYCLYLAAAIGYLIFHIICLKKQEKEKRKKVRKTIRYIKYPIRAFLLTYSLIMMIIYGATETSKIIYIISVIGYFIQIIFQVFLKFLRNYVDLFSESLKMDYDQSSLVKAAVNSYRYPKPVERSRTTKMIMDKIKSGVNDFVENNKDSAPKEELSPRQIKIRGEIESLKCEYLLNYVEPEQPKLELSDDDFEEMINDLDKKVEKKTKKEAKNAVKLEEENTEVEENVEASKPTAPVSKKDKFFSLFKRNK